MLGLSRRQGIDVLVASAGCIAIALHLCAAHFGFTTATVFKSIAAVAICASVGLTLHALRGGEH
jgi:hypothetical protein